MPSSVAAPDAAARAAPSIATPVRRSGEGMPVSKQPGRRGNLLIKFDVAFPRSLSSSQKEQLRGLLPA